MKAIIITVFTFMFLSGNSQTYLLPEIGRSTLNNVCGIKVGYEYKSAFVEGSMLTHLDRYNPAYFGGNVGYEVKIGEVGLSPLIGYNYRLISVDKRSANGWSCSYGLRLEYKHISFGVSGISGVSFITLGFKGFLN